MEEHTQMSLSFQEWRDASLSVLFVRVGIDTKSARKKFQNILLELRLKLLSAVLRINPDTDKERAQRGISPRSPSLTEK